MQAYCVKCKATRSAKGSVVSTDKGRKQFRGTCDTCGCKVVKFVSGDSKSTSGKSRDTKEAPVAERDTVVKGLKGLPSLRVEIPTVIDTRPEEDDLFEIALAIYARLVERSVGGQGVSARAAAAARINAAIGQQGGAGASVNRQLGEYLADALCQVLLAQGVEATPESWGRLVPREVAAASGGGKPASAVEAALNLLLPGEHDLGGDGQVSSVTVGGRSITDRAAGAAGAAAGEAGASALLSLFGG